MTDELMKNVADRRAQMYRSIGGLYIMEVDPKQLERLKRMRSKSTDVKNEDIKDGLRSIEAYLENAADDAWEDLAADYAKVFLAAGDAMGRAAVPYESVYTDSRRQVGGSAQMQMQALYLARGWRADPEAYRTMEDHIGLMLEYMGILCEELAEALRKEEGSRCKALLLEQLDFVKKHLENWVSDLVADIVKYADSGFYKGLAKITAGLIAEDSAFLGKVAALWDIG